MKMLRWTDRNRWLLMLLCLGVGLRIRALLQTVLINPDGALYIYQAEMLAAAKWKALADCGLSYVSIYPFLIAGVHVFTGDWINAAQLISFFFSSAALVPIYLTCRRFFDARIAAAASLIAAMSPVMCSRSGDVVRDPIYWFFLAWGIYLVLRYWDDRSRYRLLFLASLAFLLALWARIEAIVPLAVSAACLLFLGRSQFWKRLAAFGCLLMILALVVLFSMLSLHIPMDRLLRLDQIFGRLTYFVDAYHQVADGMRHLPSGDMPEIVQQFLPEARNHIWLVAIGTLINRSLEAFFYPFVPFFIVGLLGARSLVMKDRRWAYLLLLFISGYIILYVHLLSSWILEYRFLMLVFIPGLPFAAAGVARATEVISARWHFDRKKVLAALVLLLLIAGIPKNILSRDQDKIVFRRIADRISEVQGNAGPALISCSRHTHRLLSLYANIHQPDPPCPEADSTDGWSRYADDMDQMIRYLKQNNFNFFLYEERYWPRKEFHPEKTPAKDKLELVGQWYHRDTGQMRLYHLR